MFFFGTHAHRHARDGKLTFLAELDQKLEFEPFSDFRWGLKGSGYIFSRRNVLTSSLNRRKDGEAIFDFFV